MRNFAISAVIDLILILISYVIFKGILSGPTRHRLYEKFLSSFAKFIIYIVIVTAAITIIAAYILYRTQYVVYLNIIAPALVSLLVGFIMSTVPVKGIEQKKQRS